MMMPGFESRGRLLAGLLAAAVISACGRSPEASFDFAANVGLAMLRLETRELDFGRPAARAHLLEGWSEDETMSDGRPVVWAVGSRSSLWFDRFTPGPAILRFLVQELPEVDGPQRITVSINNIVAGEVFTRHPDSPKDAGFRVFNVQIPASVLRIGTNVAAFRISPTGSPPEAGNRLAAAMAWDWLQLGPALGRRRAEHIGNDLWIPVPARLEYRLNVPADSRLRIATVRPVGSPTLPAGAALTVTVTWDDGATPELVTVNGTALESGVSLPFEHATGGWARLSFTAQGVADAPELDGLDLVAPRLLSAVR